MKIKSGITLFVAIFALAGVALNLTSCSDKSATATSAGGSSAYNGVGSKWTANFDSAAGTFEITYDTSVSGEADGTVDMTVSGTYVEYSNRIRKLTVTSATGSGAPSAGSTAYGIEVPGFAFFLKPLDAREPIVLLKAGTCPSATLSANWLKASFDSAPTDGTPSSSDAFGGANFTNASGTYTGSLDQYAFHDGALLNAGAPGPVGSCADGVLTFSAPGGGTGTMFMTSNGGALVKSTGGIIFAAPKTTGATLATLDGTYTALVFSGNKYTGIPQIFPGKLTFSSGTGSGFQITDVETDAVSGSGPTFALSYIASSDGLYRGTITNGHGANPLNCMVSQVGGEQILACNGAGRPASSNQYSDTFFVLGVKR